VCGSCFFKNSFALADSAPLWVMSHLRWLQEDTGFGGLNGGNIKIAPPNMFA
jgi:hypothetical protein